MSQGKTNLIVQDESKRRIMPQRSPEDGVIDWNKPAIELDRFIRAQTRPYPGAFTMLDGKRLTIWTTRKREVISKSQPGLIIAQGDKYLIVCKQGCLELADVDYAGNTYDEARLHQLLGEGGQQLN
jgi:methionyl-tRNA formyltransferase